MKFLNAVSFLTIIKISERYYLDQKEYPKVLAYFPLVGVLIGLINSAVFFAFNLVFPLVLTFILIAGFEVIITGGIHIDGAADTFDGVFSGEKDKEKITKIMKKGDIGVFGALAIIFSIGLKIAFFYFIARQLNVSSLLRFSPGSPWALSGFSVSRLNDLLPGFFVLLTILIFVPVFGRLSMIYLFSRYQPASGIKSLTNAFKDKSNRDIFIFSTVFFSIIFIAASVFSRISFIDSAPDIKLEYLALVYAIQAFLIIIFTLFFSVGLGHFFTKRTGGLSGDVIGAVCVLTEIFFLVLTYLSVVLT